MFYAFVRACGGKEGEVRAFYHRIERDLFVKRHDNAETISCDNAACKMRKTLSERATAREKEIIARMGMSSLYITYADYKSGY